MNPAQPDSMASLSVNEEGRLSSLRESEERFRQLAENIHEVFG